MRILFLGDIVAASGRSAVIRCAPMLRQALKLDLLCANAENAAHGFGLTPKIAESLLESGLDILTTGNHVWDQPQIISYLEENPTAPILRPINMGASSRQLLPGRGYADLEISAGRKVRVINAIGNIFMQPCENPWYALEPLLRAGKFNATTGSDTQTAELDAIIIDFHAEATGEKLTLARLCDGRASALLGTHTHIPTADPCLLPKGLAYQSDIGMCGCYESVIGMEIETASARYLQSLPRAKLQPALGIASLAGVYFETSSATGCATRIEPFRLAASDDSLLRTSLPQECLPYKNELQGMIAATN